MSVLSTFCPSPHQQNKFCCLTFCSLYAIISLPFCPITNTAHFKIMLISLLLKRSFYPMFRSTWHFSNCSVGFYDSTQSISSCLSQAPLFSLPLLNGILAFFFLLFLFILCLLLSLCLFLGLSLSSVCWWFPFFHLKACLWALGSYISLLPIRHLHSDIPQILQDQYIYNNIFSPFAFRSPSFSRISDSVIHLAWNEPEIWLFGYLSSLTSHSVPPDSVSVISNIWFISRPSDCYFPTSSDHHIFLRLLQYSLPHCSFLAPIHFLLSNQTTYYKMQI